MIVLCRIEHGSGNEFCYDGLFETFAERFFGFFRQAFLSFIMVKDCRAILTTDVAKLPVERERIDIVPEHLEQLFVSYLLWIIGNLDHLCVSGLAGRYFLIRRIFLCTPGVTRDGRNEPVELVKRWFHAPETAAGKSGFRCGGGSARLRCGISPSRQQ